MKNNQRGFSVLSGTLALAGAGVILAGGVTYHAGAVRVSVHEKRPGGDSIRIIVPAVVVPAVLALTPAKAFHQVPPEARQALPALRIAMEELGKLPDCTLVEVHDHGEEVQISIHGGVLAVDVESDDEEVHVQVPLGALESVVSKLSSSIDREERSERHRF